MIIIFIAVAYLLWAYASWSYCDFPEPKGCITQIIVITLFGWVAIIWALIVKFFER